MGTRALKPNYSRPIAVVAPYATGEKRPDPRLRVWMSAGSHEPYILDDTRTMQGWFERFGQPLRVVYTHGGHRWGTWRHLVKDALRYFYPPTALRSGQVSSEPTMCGRVPDPGGDEGVRPCVGRTLPAAPEKQPRPAGSTAGCSAPA